MKVRLDRKMNFVLFKIPFTSWEILVLTELMNMWHDFRAKNSSSFHRLIVLRLETKTAMYSFALYAYTPSFWVNIFKATKGSLHDLI